ncbi:MAG: efflux RND transporter periplasmic adaptor subunit [Pirellulales bacterium]
MKKLLLFLVVVGLVAGGMAYFGGFMAAAPLGSPYRTAPVERGDMLITVSATGTVEPEELVDIGAQVVGRIKTLGDDPRSRTDPKFQGKHVDYGSPVEEGMLLVQIDPAIYDAQFKQADAALSLAKANLLQMEAMRMQADAEWKRARKLSELKLTTNSPTGSIVERSLPVKGISDADFVLARANYDSAEANVEAAKATVKQQEASRLLAQTNLEYTTIRSPVSGTIIARRINIGQTVVSSLSAPSLFLIARDLRRMQVWASVNEADIGQLKVDMPVHFSVDAFPNDDFHGRVEQIRLNAAMTSNVVIYTVVIAVDNSDLRLLPYLTADVNFEVDRRQDALLVPNAALRYLPPANRIAPSTSAAAQSTAADLEGTETNWGTVWVQQGENNLLSPVKVAIGTSDGAFTEILSGELKEGMAVVLGERRADETVEVNNPFAPPRWGGKKKTKS